MPRKELTRAEAFAQLRDLLVKYAPTEAAALEIFDAVTDLESATIREMRVVVLDTISGTVTS